jgi:hypothetical protein
MSVSLRNWIYRGVKCLCRFETGYTGVSNVSDALKRQVPLWRGMAYYSPTLKTP